MTSRISALVLLASFSACKSRADQQRRAPSEARTTWDQRAEEGFAAWDKPRKDRDVSRAKRAWQEACDHGSQLGCTGLATEMLSTHEGDARRGIAMLEKACAANTGRACAALATVYETGNGIERDGVKAMRIAQDSCTRGEHRSCVLYARSLMFGNNGVDRDPEKSRDLGVKACDAGIAAGCTLTGLVYSNALHDAIKAQQWLQRGCDAGDGSACAALAVQYSRGGLPGDASGVAVSLERAAQFASRACDLDAPIGCSLYAKALANGDGVARDVARAKQLANKACDDADAAGCSVAAKIATAEGDVASATRFYERSCRLGNAVACREASP